LYVSCDAAVWMNVSLQRVKRHLTQVRLKVL